MHISKNILYIVSTPIGNLDDITLRAIDVLKKSDIILCEDTRRSLKLLNHFKIKKKLISYHKFNEKKQIERILKHINEGKILSLISDAGTPLLSDPGKILINECIKRDIKLIPIPGVSSITTAMSISGFNDQFLFYGFLPKKENEINKILLNLSSYEFTQIFFIPAVKLNFYLEIFKRHYKNRKILIAKEMTKIHEAFYREDIIKLSKLKITDKGELTVILSEEIKKKEQFNENKIINKAKIFLKRYSLKDTVDLILETEKISRKKVYKICLRIKNEKN
tara:strand:+ start:863 stop:1699 length:837 start_codon:yes stop_codon:yes gene_type:complete